MYGGVVAPYQYARMVQILCFVQASTATGWSHSRTELDGDFSNVLGWLSSHWPESSSVWYRLQPWSMCPVLRPWRWRQGTKQETLHGSVLAARNRTHGHWSNQWHIVSWLLFSPLIFSLFQDMPNYVLHTCMLHTIMLSHHNLYPRHTFTTRWLFSGISSHLYYQDWTIDDLLGEFAKQAIDAFETGVCVPQIH